MSKSQALFLAVMTIAVALSFLSFLSAAALMILMGNIHTFASAVPAISIGQAFSVTLPIGVITGIMFGIQDGLRSIE